MRRPAPHWTMAGVTAAHRLGLLTDEAARQMQQEIQCRLEVLRAGPVGEKRRAAKQGIWQR